MNYAQAVNFIKQRRQNDLIRAEYAYSEALERFPSLKKADEKYRAAVVRSLKSGGEGQAPDEKRALDEEIGRLGLQNTLFPAPHCSKCGDTGYCGGKICDCALSLSTSSEFISFPLHDFKDIDYSLFSQHDAARFRKTAGDFEIIFGEKFPDTNAVFCVNDYVALGAYKCLRERGLRVPQDISVCGCDDLLIKQIDLYIAELQQLRSSISGSADSVTRQ